MVVSARLLLSTFEPLLRVCVPDDVTNLFIYFLRSKVNILATFGHRRRITGPHSVYFSL